MTPGKDGGNTPRQATPADLPEIGQVITEAYTPYLDRMDKPPAPMLADYGAAIARGEVWVVGEPIVGVIVLVAESDGLHVENVAVSTAAKGTGKGRQLMNFAELNAIKRGLNRLTLYTNEIMTENLAIYARLGYREVARRTQDGYRRVYLEKLLLS